MIANNPSRRDRVRRGMPLKESDIVTGVLVGAAPAVVLVPRGIAVLRDRIPQLRVGAHQSAPDVEPPRRRIR
ncbi:hypothetical protein [Streptomyces winkii]|uniref:hypothetical protein n=1 Tax=Streptomyces winkii TaxID=3051178 RepID=UPI0028D87A0C|nr:hypothetical protein [Streptomyces sp. DSM 40971]